jgi:hypothetical protein
MQRILMSLVAVTFTLAADRTASADFLIYNLPNSRSSFVLEGTVQVNPGRTVTYFHPTLKEKLIFALEDVKIQRVPTNREEFNRKLGQAGKDADKAFEASVWALKRGLLRDYYQGVDKVLQIDAKHEDARRIVELKKEMDKSLPDDSNTESELKRIVNRPTMRIAKSKHFILLHDTPEKPAAGRKKNRAQERLDLLEQVYESFLLLFHSQDVQLDIPQERMKVVLFNEHQDYLEFATSWSPSLSSTSGFWEAQRNVSVFYDHATDEQFKGLQALMKELREVKDDAKKAAKKGATNAKDVIRFVNTLELLAEVAQENEDITVVSHEATHQMAGNTGLFPRSVLVPSWVHEGLATYFEAPGDAVWSGIGAVNADRLNWYRGLEPDRVHSNIGFIVGDQIFDFAATHGGKLHGYGQAWALTHFLLERHLKEFVAYYRMLGEMPPDVALSQELLSELFNKAFQGTTRTALDQEWRSYMRSLKTDMDLVAERAEKSSKKK